jgi:lincosamide nucleotidyltransferase A/C/D/E
MQAIDVVEVVDRLDATGIEWWIEGGWGVDALLGRQTREHGDLDLGVYLSDVPRVESELSEFQRIETGEWPRFLLLEDEHGRRVDLALGADGVRPERARGRIGGREVRCVSLEVQLNQARTNDLTALRDILR